MRSLRVLGVALHVDPVGGRRDRGIGEERGERDLRGGGLRALHAGPDALKHAARRFDADGPHGVVLRAGLRLVHLDGRAHAFGIRGDDGKPARISATIPGKVKGLYRPETWAFHAGDLPAACAWLDAEIACVEQTASTSIK